MKNLILNFHFYLSLVQWGNNFFFTNPEFGNAVNMRVYRRDLIISTKS